MKITMQTLVGSFDALKELSEAKLPAASALRVALLMKQFAAPLEEFQNTYNKLIQECGEKNDSGTFDIKDRDRFVRESGELLAVEVTVPDDKLKSLGSAEMKPSSLLALDWLIDL